MPDLDEYDRRQAWKLYALSYDRVLPRLPFYQEAVRRHVAVMSRPEIQDVIDVGAGTGNVTVELLERGRRVTAVDLSPEMLDKLREKTVGHSQNLTILERNAQDLSLLPDNSFDGATILLAFFDIDQPRRALEEVLRVLRRGGSIVTTETKMEFQLEPLLHFVDSFLSEQGLSEDLCEDWERVMKVNRVLDPGRRLLRLTVEDIIETLQEANFEIERVEDSHLGQCATVWARNNDASRLSSLQTHG